MSFLAEDLISSIKLRTLMPSSQNTFQDTDLLSIATEVLWLKLCPLLMGVREDFFLTVKNYPTVANVPLLALPERAMGSSLKSVYILDGASNPKELTKSDQNKLEKYPLSGTPEAFFFAGDEIRFMPIPSDSTNTIDFWHFLRPNSLVATTSCAKISSISTVAGTTTFTVDTDLTSSLSVGSKVDFLSAKSPYLLWQYDVAITAITSTTIAVATTGVDNEAGTVEPIVGDYICPAGQSNIPQIPVELHALLAQECALFILESLGHLDKWQLAKARRDDLQASGLKLFANRVEASPNKIVSKYGFVPSTGRSIVRRMT